MRFVTDNFPGLTCWLMVFYRVLLGFGLLIRSHEFVEFLPNCWICIRCVSTGFLRFQKCNRLFFGNVSPSFTGFYLLIQIDFERKKGLDRIGWISIRFVFRLFFFSHLGRTLPSFTEFLVILLFFSFFFSKADFSPIRTRFFRWIVLGPVRFLFLFFFFSITGFFFSWVFLGGTDEGRGGGGVVEIRPLSDSSVVFSECDDGITGSFIFIFCKFLPVPVWCPGHADVSVSSFVFVFFF